MNIPKPNRISQWGDMREIIYKCRNCGQEFNIYSYNEKFCHNCGTENHWKDVPIKVTERVSKMYHDADVAKQREIMEYIDKLTIEGVDKDE